MHGRVLQVLTRLEITLLLAKYDLDSITKTSELLIVAKWGTELFQWTEAF